MTSDPVDRAISSLLDRPALAAGAGLALLGILAIAVFVVQEVFIVLWFFGLVFVFYLVWRFIRAFELMARAVDRYVDDQHAD